MRGRGEIVVGRPDTPAVELTILVPSFAIATADVYAAHRREHQGRGVLPARLDIEGSGRFFGANDLAKAILAIRPEMGALLQAARAASEEAAITGSGSAIVLFRPLEDAGSRLAAAFPGGPAGWL